MKKRILLVIAILTFIILCFVFNEYDLNISVNLTKYDNGFYETFDDYGELPVYVGPILFGVVYFYLSKKIIYKLMSLGITGVAYLVAIYKIFDNKEIELSLSNIVLIIGIALILFLATVYAFSKVNKDILVNLKDLALVGLITTIASVACVEVLKLTWGRVRFRDLSSDYSEFTNLFTVNGYTGNKSFPSGHTNAATSILLISLMIPRFTNKKWIKYLVASLCFVYIAFVAVSRIVVSAHYASDVMVGFVVGLLTISLTYYILKRKGVINVANDKC